MRLNDNNSFIGINPPYQLSVIHSSKLIYPREIYQRGVERKRVELIARDFNEYIVNEPKVSFRNDRYYVMDGQHTIEGCILLNGGEDRPDPLQGLHRPDDGAGGPALCGAERSRRTPVGRHQAARQGGGRRYTFQGVCRSYQPGGAGRMQTESAEPNPSAQDFL